MSTEEGSMDQPEFDLDKYLRASRKVDLGGVRWDEIRSHPVSPAEAWTLAYMMDIESHTVIFLRDLLATRAALEPDVTAFLSCWVYEELWHGEAFSRFLGEAGFALLPDGERVGSDGPYPSRVGRNSWIRRKLQSKGYASHVGTMLGSTLTRDFPALHMTWGAVNELATLQGYRQMIAKTGNPVLVDLLTRIIKDERRHFAFYRAQARMRLARSAKARAITRWALERLWAPVGTGVRPQEETDFAIAYLFGDDEGRRMAGEMDGILGELPGLAGIRICRTALDETLARIGPRFERMRVATPLAAFRS